MIKTPEIQIERIAYAWSEKPQEFWALVKEALANLRSEPSFSAATLGGVIAATFSNPERFPSLAVRVAAELNLPPNVPAFDLQMACSAYPYAVYLAGRLAADTGKKILVVNGDVQSALVDRADHATGNIFSDAFTCSVVSSVPVGESCFDFFSQHDSALQCPATGPIRMDGMKVFTFVATQVRMFLKEFLAASSSTAASFSFVPHQAQPYMVRQLAKALSLESRLVTLDESFRNPGSASIPLTLATRGVKGEVLLAGFGAGYSAAVGKVRVL